MFSDYFELALRTFKHKQTRSWLTIIGIFIGIAAVIALISLGQGMQNAINQQFEVLGTNKITIYPGASSFGVIGSLAGSERMSDHDISLIKKIKGIEKIVGISLTVGKIKDRGTPRYTIITGYDPNQINMKDFIGVSMTDGRELKSNDGYKIMVGYDIGYGDFFDKPVKVGDTLTIADTSFTVVGIVSKIGNPAYDRRIYLTQDIFNKVFKQAGYPMLVAKTKQGYDPSAVAESIKTELRKDRNLKEGNENFTVMTSEQLKQIIFRIIGLIQNIVIGIAAISLLVGGIGIMNTMYTSVLERTREIGIMKAVGARNWDIAMIFLIESGIIGLIGGTIGIVLGLSAALGVQAVAKMMNVSLNVSFDIVLLIWSLAFSFIIGSLSGLLPAMQAARMKPAEALRYE